MGFFDIFKKRPTDQSMPVSEAVSRLTCRRTNESNEEYTRRLSNMGFTADSYRKDAEDGKSLAQFNMGVCYREGYGVAKNYKEAISWFEKAEAQGDLSATACIGVLYHKGGYGIEKDLKKSFEYLSKAADSGDPE